MVLFNLQLPPDLAPITVPNNSMTTLQQSLVRTQISKVPQVALSPLAAI